MRKSTRLSLLHVLIRNVCRYDRQSHEARMEDDAAQAQRKSPDSCRKLSMLSAQGTDDMVSRPASRAVSSFPSSSN